MDSLLPSQVENILRNICTKNNGNKISCTYSDIQEKLQNLGIICSIDDVKLATEELSQTTSIVILENGSLRLSF